MFQKRGDKVLSDIELKLKLSFVKIKSEIDDHRQAINENTNEIQSNYEYLCKLESKFDKLSQTVEQLSLFMKQILSNNSVGIINNTNIDVVKNVNQIQKLTENEQQILLLLLHKSSEDHITYNMLAYQLELSIESIHDYITRLIAKGVPVLKKYVSSTAVALYLPEQFKLQFQDSEQLLYS